MKRCVLLLLLAFPMLASADVTFYSKCDYKGPGVALAPGDYTAREMLQFGIPQDSISAVDVPRGLTVTLYENDLFDGRYGTLKRSDPCLTNDRFDDVVSSISIRESFEVTTPIAQADTRSNAGITLYTECGFAGSSAIVGEGNYNLSQLKKLGIPDNTVSSVKVADGYAVTLYENDFLRGRSGRLVQDLSCLQNDKFDDTVSSVAVVRSADAVIETPTPAAVAQSAITLYSECNYKGRAVNVEEGEFSTEMLLKLGVANNSISSIRVSDGFQVELFENDFYRGSSGTLRQNDNCLVDDRFNDTISSLIVSRDPRAVADAEVAATVKDNRVGVTVFGHCNYKGGSVKIKVGEYNVDALKALRIKDNVISSFKVEKGFQVTMYDAADFTGQGKIFTENDSCLDDDRLNEAVSSLVVEPLKVTRPTNNQVTQIRKPTVTSSDNDLAAVNKALQCVEQYVSRGLCDSHRWANISQRCDLAKTELMTDGYLRGHVDAGNCKTEYWEELSRRVANPAQR